MITKLQKGKIITKAASSGIFANAKSTASAAQAIKDVNKAVGVVTKRPRILISHTPERQYIKVTPLSALNAENRVAQAAQRAIEDKAYEIKSNQIDLERKLQRRWNEQGINTPGWMKKAMMRAIEIDPKTSTPPVEGQYKLPYRSWYKNRQPMMLEGETVKDWMNAAGDLFSIGPHSTILQAIKPFQAASAYYDNVGDIVNTKTLSTREPINKASYINMMMLKDGMERLRDWWFKDSQTKKSIPTIPKVKPIKNIAVFERPVTTITTDAERFRLKDLGDGEYQIVSNFEQPETDFEEIFRRNYGYEGDLLDPLKEKCGGKI